MISKNLTVRTCYDGGGVNSANLAAQVEATGIPGIENDANNNIRGRGIFHSCWVYGVFLELSARCSEYCHNRIPTVFAFLQNITASECTFPRHPILDDNGLKS